MNTIKILQPAQVVFGNGCSMECAAVFTTRGFKRVLVVSTVSVLKRNQALIESLTQAGCTVVASLTVGPEPTRAQFDELLLRARGLSFDAVLGLGGGSAMDVGKRGVEHLAKLSRDCGVPEHLSEFKVPREAIPGMAAAAMQVTRLLKNNVRPLSEADARAIYEAAF